MGQITMEPEVSATTPANAPESIAQLRARCQGPARGTDSFWMRRVGRTCSIYLTSLLIKTPMSANQVTALFIVMGWGIAALMAVGTPAAMLTGGVLLQVWFIFDGVDGELARYRGTASLKGMYLDHMSHAMVRPFVFAGIGWGLYRTTGHASMVAAGGLAAISSVLLPLSSAMKASVAHDLTTLSLPSNYFSEPPAPPSGEPVEAAARSGGWLKSLARNMPRDPAVINSILIAAIIDAASGGRPIRAAELVLAGYAVFLTLIWIKTVQRASAR